MTVGHICPDATDDITHRAYARVGLLGNPSDGYFGKCISVSVQNFFAEVTLTPNQQMFSSRVTIEPGPSDSTVFESLETLAVTTAKSGYYGGVRLLRALCFKFQEYCAERGYDLAERGFTLEYDSNIPTQAGLSGSSAIIVAGLKCLMQHYRVYIPLDDQPALVLSCEHDLGINAGLQDRVIQCYEGVVYMDFSNEEMVRTQGKGVYTRLPETCLPPLHIVYDDNPSDSGKVHADVKQRWERGDADVRSKMSRIAEIAERGYNVLSSIGTDKQTGEPMIELGMLMNANFNLRKEMFGAEALGARNVEMIDTARGTGSFAKFTGSGGAAVVLCPTNSEEEREAMYADCEAKGFKVCPLVVNPGKPSGGAA